MRKKMKTIEDRNSKRSKQCRTWNKVEIGVPNIGKGKEILLNMKENWLFVKKHENSSKKLKNKKKFH